jgi:pimeloyl-ACP methyl ester carboxylesterase
MTREALRAAGFVRTCVGDTVYWTGGEGGPPFVLVHGVNDQAGSWCAVAPALAKGARVILPDLAGHGESGPREGPIPIDLLVGRLAAVIDVECSGEIRLVGNSLGGWISALYALGHPGRVKHLVLEAAGGLSRPFASPVVARTPDEAVMILRAVHGPGFVAPQWLIDSILQRGATSPMLRVTGVSERFLDARLGELRCPVTLVWGENDGVLPISYAEEMRDGIAGAGLCVIRGAAHIPHAQQPAEVLRCLTAIS